MQHSTVWKGVPRNWDVDARLTASERQQKYIKKMMSAAYIRDSIFCLNPGDQAKLFAPISAKRLQEIVRRAKKKWPALVERQFHKVRDEYTVRRKI